MKFLMLISHVDNGFVLKIVSPVEGEESRIYAFESVEGMCKFIQDYYSTRVAVKTEWK